jgi:outer membrane protein assembly factor BamA
MRKSNTLFPLFPKIILFITAIMLAWVNQKAPAFAEDSTWDGVLVVEVGDSSKKNSENSTVSQNSTDGDKTVKDIQIRFLNNKDESVDENGEPIKGRTQRDFILGNLQLKQGEVFSIDLLQKDLQRLRRLEPFDKVEVSLEEDAAGVSVIYSIRERRYPSLSFGGGNSDDYGLYGSVGYTDANIGGVSDKIDANVRVSGVELLQFDAQFTSPYRRSEPNRLGYTVSAFRSRELSQTFDDKIRLANGDRVREGRFGGSVGVLRSFGDVDAALAVNYTRVSLRDRNYDVVQQDRLGSPLSVSGTGIDDLVTVSLSLTQDLRNRRNTPTSGSILSVSTEQAIPIGLGSISSNRLRANYVQYIPVKFLGNGGTDRNPEMFAFNVQAGTIIGEFPPALAFNLGGSNSVRGYDLGKISSARSFGLVSLEYRFPIQSWIGGVLFTDLATDFGTGKDVLGEPGVLRNKPGSGFGYGVGLRWLSPIGLIRGDLGVSDQGEVKFEVRTGQRF